ncbi:MAG: NIPSNAP family protein [Luteimonas sp.]|nr:NIPSNAP family protein [Luteimonas sp.]
MRLAAVVGGLLAMLSVGHAGAAAPEKPATHPGHATTACCPIVELRQYTLYPGTRDAFIPLFESTFIESQEAVGIVLTGLFRDINDANRFVWMRGFDSMQARLKALTDFYYGPVWQAHRGQANPMLYDNDNVLLLHPAATGSGFVVDAGKRPAVGDRPVRNDFVVGTIYYFEQPVPEAFVAQFEQEFKPLFEKSGARVLASYVSEKSPNTFERLPVREQDNVFVWFAGFADRQAYDQYIDRLGRDERWNGGLFASLNKALQRPPETLMLQPTARSLVGH